MEAKSSAEDCWPGEEITVEVTGAAPNSTLVIFPRIESTIQGSAAPAKHLLPISVFVKPDGSGNTNITVPKDLPFESAQLVLHILQMAEEHTLRIGIIEEEEEQ